jgi:maltose alpha-D-glucosyltransferase/alpha-amylase
MLRQMIAVRQSVQIFGRGTMTVLYPKNRKIMTYLREFEGEVILVINNLSDSTESVTIDLSRYSGWTPVEMFSDVCFPKISRAAYHFALSPYGFFWLKLILTGNKKSRNQLTPIQGRKRDENKGA